MTEHNNGGANPTGTRRISDCEMEVTRTFNAPARLVFEAWSNPDLFQRWWVPESAGLKLLSCEMDVRTGGGYRLVFEHGSGNSMAFFGTYTDVVPGARMVWTNEESDEGSITTVTFEESGGRTRVVYHERYPTKEALDAMLEAMDEGMDEQFSQLDALLAAQAAGAA